MTADKFETQEQQTMSQGSNANSTASARMLEETQIQEARQLLDWGKNNFGRFDLSGDRRLNRAELNTGMRTADSDVDQQMLSKLAQSYERLKEQNSGLFGHKDSLTVSDLEKNVKVQEENARKAEEDRIALARLEAQQAGSRDLMAPLLRTGDGNAQRSLFKVLDDVKGNRADNEVSRSDLDRFIKEYDRRARYGDVGSGVYTEENRQYVQSLKDNWYKPEVERLRGTYKDTDGRDRVNSTISLDSLREAGALRDVFGSFATGEAVAKANVEHVNYGETPSFKKVIPQVQELPEMAKEREDQRAQMDMAGQMRNWAGNNFGRFDLTGDRKWSYGEVDTGRRTADTDVDYNAMSYYSGNFGKIARDNRTRISMDDINRHARTEVEMFDQAEQQRQAALAQRQAQAEAHELMSPLMTTRSGQAQDSLFGVIDGLKGSPDDKVGKGDLEKYLKEFDRRARHDDIGTSHFTLPERQYVQYLVDNWSNSDVVALRGQWWSEQQQRHIPNRNITLQSLREAANLQGDPYRPFRVANASEDELE